MTAAHPSPVARPRAIRRATITGSALLLAVGVMGCGNARQAAPDVATPGPAFGSESAAYPQAGLTLRRAPAGWARISGTAPAVVTITTGEAVIGVFRYPRTQSLPTTKAALRAAATTLVAAAKARDPSFREIKRSRLRVDGQPAVQVRGTETVDGKPRTVRTTHVYAFGGEIVVDAFAPEADFRRVDAQVFRPLVASMRVRAPRGGP